MEIIQVYNDVGLNCCNSCQHSVSVTKKRDNVAGLLLWWVGYGISSLSTQQQESQISSAPV